MCITGERLKNDGCSNKVTAFVSPNMQQVMTRECSPKIKAVSKIAQTFPTCRAA